MIKLAYHFKCDVPQCSVESLNNIGDVSHRMMIPEIPIPNGWHYLDHRIVCNAHSVIIDKKWVDATPESAEIDEEPFLRQGHVNTGDYGPYKVAVEVAAPPAPKTLKVVKTEVNPVKIPKRKKK